MEFFFCFMDSFVQGYSFLLVPFIKGDNRTIYKGMMGYKGAYSKQKIPKNVLD